MSSGSVGDHDSDENPLADNQSPQESAGTFDDSSVDFDTSVILESLPVPSEFVARVLERVPETHLLRGYLSEIARVPSLSDSEEQELLLVAREKGPKGERARKKLNESYMRLVVWVAKEYHRSSVQLTDLINEGALGLMESVKKFQPESDSRFVEFATQNIRKSISQALSEETRLSRVPAYLLDKITSIKGVTRTLADELGREPTRAEIADALGLEADELERLIKLVGHAPPPEEENGQAEGEYPEDSDDSDFGYDDYEGFQL